MTSNKGHQGVVRDSEEAEDNEEQETAAIVQPRDEGYCEWRLARGDGVDFSARNDELLIDLQKQNRLLRKLRVKDPRQIELERLEQGFSIYLNGANADGKRVTRKALLPPRNVWTAGPSRQGGDVQEGNTGRSRTAPGKCQRKGWQQSSVQLKTDEGHWVRLAGPVEYSEDFDLDADTDTILDAEEAAGKGSLENALESTATGAKFAHKCEPQNKLLLTLTDVKALRKSLEFSLSTNISSHKLKEGVTAMDSDKNSSEDSIEEDLDGGSSPGSPGEPQAATALCRSSQHKGTAAKPPAAGVSSGELIVLEFAPAGARRERVLSAKRKADASSVVPTKAMLARSGLAARAVIVNPASMPQDDQTIDLQSGSSKRLERPLSASRREVSQEVDLTSRAQAVAQAVQAENRSMVASTVTRQPVQASSSPSENYSFSKAMENIQQMDVWQQKKLLQALGKLELSTSVPSNDVGTPKSNTDGTLSPRISALQVDLERLGTSETYARSSGARKTDQDAQEKSSNASRDCQQLLRKASVSDEELSMKDQLEKGDGRRIVSSEEPQEVPAWLEGAGKREKMEKKKLSKTKWKPPWLEGDVDLCEDPTDRNRNKATASTSCVGEAVRSARSIHSSSSSGEERGTWDTLRGEECGRGEIDLVSFLDAGSRKADRPLSGRRSVLQTTKCTEVPMFSGQESGGDTRAWWAREQDRSLLDSWDSLLKFDRTQKGRLPSLDLLDMEAAGPASPCATRLAEDSLFISSNTCDGPERHTLAAAPPTGPLPNNADALPCCDPAEPFEIPELPYGRRLVINIRSTWGDSHYVGLNGLEVFTSTGVPAKVARIWAEPADVNVLPGYGNDPRVVSNLLDNVNRSRDDAHMWLAPFTVGADHLVTLELTEACHLAMLRVWNYNKSRVHASRGARHLHVTLDGREVFRGEIARASGTLTRDLEQFGDTILFTMDDGILEAMAAHDVTFTATSPDVIDPAAGTSSEGPSDETERPHTAHGDSPIDNPDSPSIPHPNVVRPATRAGRGPHTGQEAASGETSPQPYGQYVGKCLKLSFSATWGDPHYLGLTGLEVVGSDGAAVVLQLSMLDAKPRDLNDLPEYMDDNRTLDKLIDGVNVTVSDEHMWLIPFSTVESHILTVTLLRSEPLTGLRLWNYNKSAEDTYRGAKTVHVTLDGKAVSPPEGFLIRKGPGNCHFDFMQEIVFADETRRCGNKSGVLTNRQKDKHAAVLERASMDYEAPLMPCGFLFQFQLLSSWGDPYYIGLNSLQFYDEEGEPISLTPKNIAAYPDSVNVLDGVSGDVRTPDKLLDGVTDGGDGRQAWLAPLLPNLVNRVYVIFDCPTTVSMIKLWNYSKTSQRGVKEFGLLVDDLLVYNGVLEAVSQAARGILPTCSAPTPYHTILFTDRADVLRRERHTVLRNRADEQEVSLLNDNRILQSSKKKASVDQALRPKTCLIERKVAGRKQR